MASNNSERVQVGRLAFRREGEVWNCYFAQVDTMDGAIFLGSLSMRLAEVPSHKQAFMDLMRAVFEDVCADAIGIKPTWGGPTPGPEHERSGRA